MGKIGDYSATMMKKCCRPLSIPILYLAKMHHANHCAQFKKTSLFFLITISHLNCPPLPDPVSVELHWYAEQQNLLLKAQKCRTSYLITWVHTLKN